MAWETAVIAVAAACCAAGPGRAWREPVKQRDDPVACRDCGRPTWSLAGRCVFCRLGWPDPDQSRRAMSIGDGVAGAEGPLRRFSPPTIRCPRCDADLPPASTETDTSTTDTSTTDHAQRCPRCGAPIEHAAES